MPEIISQEDRPDSIQVVVNDETVSLFLHRYELSSERMPYELDQTHGLDASGVLGTEFDSEAQDDTILTLIQFIASGDVRLLEDAKLRLVDRPQKGEISRNLGVYDPSSNQIYMLCGVGLIKPDIQESFQFTLVDPDLERGYGEYNRSIGKGEGGFRQFTDSGVEDVDNANHLGVILYEDGPRPLTRKVTQTAEKGLAGLNTPAYVAAGRIKNVGEGQYGWAIYRSTFTPDYTSTIPLLVNNKAQVTTVYMEYLNSKYAQIGKLHRDLGEIHAELTVTNTPLEIEIDGNEVKASCQIKDWDTNHAIPASTELTIEDGVAQVPMGLDVTKSPAVAAQIYDLQMAITQDLNALVFPILALQDKAQIKAYLESRLTIVLPHMVISYGLITDVDRLNEALQWVMQHFSKALNSGLPPQRFNLAIGGLLAHAIFLFHPDYRSQLNIEQS